MMNKQRYQQRRQRLMEQINTGLMLINSGGSAPDTALSDKNLAYLTGFDDREAYLLLAPQGVRVERMETRGSEELMRGHVVREILFVNERSPQATFMDGPGESLESLLESTGVDRVYPLSKLDGILYSALLSADTLWLNTARPPQFNQPLTAQYEFINRLRERFYWVQFKNVATHIHALRFVKDEDEIAALRQAFEIHTSIFERIMSTLKPGDSEALGQAIFEYEVRTCAPRVSLGMPPESYPASIIVAAGAHSVIPHYTHNSHVIQDSDLVLIDTGVTVDGYASDITRTFPANGRFTARQRELYAIVLEALHAAIDTMKPGSTMLQAHQAVYDVFKRHGVEQYSYGNCGHPVGLNIHDAHERFPDDREQPFEPGVVIVIEPFLMIPEEGIGIRIEDGVLITETGHEVLAGPPREIEDVEALCRRA